jgi:hypothetical protein
LPKAASSGLSTLCISVIATCAATSRPIETRARVFMRMSPLQKKKGHATPARAQNATLSGKKKSYLERAVVCRRVAGMGAGAGTGAAQ